MVAFVLLATNVVTNVRAESNTQPINGLSVSELSLQDDKSQANEVFSATMINKMVSLDFTFEGAMNAPLYLELKIDKKYVDQKTMHFSEFNLMQTSEAVVTEGDFLVKRYGLNVSNFQGSGNKVDFNFNFATLPYIVPNLSTINYEINLVTKSGNNFTNVFAGNADTNTILTKETVISYEGSGYYEGDYTMVYAGKKAKKIDGGIEDENRQGYLTSDKSKLDRFSIIGRVDFVELENGPSQSEIGGRGFSEIVLEFQLPANVEPANILNDGWNYDETTRILSLTVENQMEDYYVYYKSIVFPGAKINETISIPGKITATPYEMGVHERVVVYNGILEVIPQKKQIITTQPTGLYAVKQGNRMTELISSRTKTFYYSLYLSTREEVSANLPLHDITIDDFNMDSRFQYKTISASNLYNVTNHQLKIKARLDDGNLIDLYESSKNASLVRFTIPESLRSKIVSLHFDLGEEGVLDPDLELNFSLGVEMRNQIDPILGEGVQRTSMPNTATFKGNYGPGLEFEESSTGYIRFEAKEDRRYEIRKNLSSSAQNVYYIQDKPRFDILLGVKNFEGYDETISFEKTVDILPEGMNYVAGSTQLFHIMDFYNITVNEPTVIYNYKNSNRTALIWEVPDYVSDITGPESTHFEKDTTWVYRINYQTEFQSFAKRGRLTNSVYLDGFIGDNQEDYWVESNIVPDIFDINDNGNVQDLVLRSSASVNYSPPFELVSVKEIKGEAHKSREIATNQIESEIGADLTYKLRIINNGTTDTQSLGLIDLLPSEGDMTAAVDLQNNGVRTPRNSTFKPVLKEKIKEQAGFEIFYTNSQHSNFDSINQFYGAQGIWSTNPTFNLETTTAIKIIMVNRVLRPNDDLSFEFVLRMPDDASLSNSDIAVNSFGFTQNSGNTFIESNMASARVTHYDLSGYIFKDHDKDGSFNATIDQVFANHKVTLLDSSNNPIYDKSGKPIETTTSADGKYFFKVDASRRYKVKVQSPQNHLPTLKVYTNEGSHIENDNHTHDVELSFEKKSKVLTISDGKCWICCGCLKPAKY